MIKAIETRYKGYRFRSRLEARWAVWLDALGIRWQYETEGFDLGDGIRYLPDFWLQSIDNRPWIKGMPPFAGYWLEIKPVPMSEEEEKKLQCLSEQTKHHGYCFAGDPWPGEFAIHCVTIPGKCQFYAPDVCVMCGGSGLEPNVSSHEWRGKVIYLNDYGPCHFCSNGLIPISEWSCHLHLAGFFSNLLNDIPDDDSTNRAFQIARSARFEHGETPK